MVSAFSDHTLTRCQVDRRYHCQGGRATVGISGTLRWRGRRADVICDLLLSPLVPRRRRADEAVEAVDQKECAEDPDDDAGDERRLAPSPGGDGAENDAKLEAGEGQLEPEAAFDEPVASDLVAYGRVFLGFLFGALALGFGIHSLLKLGQAFIGCFTAEGAAKGFRQVARALCFVLLDALGLVVSPGVVDLSLLKDRLEVAGPPPRAGDGRDDSEDRGSAAYRFAGRSGCFGRFSGVCHDIILPTWRRAAKLNAARSREVGCG